MKMYRISVFHCQSALTLSLKQLARNPERWGLRISVFALKDRGKQNKTKKKQPLFCNVADK